jgi:uncharacterized repeat protein (TIGR03803 family)
MFSFLPDYGNDGANPGGLVLGRDGNLYGTTYYGGPNGYMWGLGVFTWNPYISDGTVFKITTNGAESILYSFGDPANPSSFGGWLINPTGWLIQSSDGNLYGMTTHGNVYVLFQLSTNGVMTIPAFDPGGFTAGLVQGNDGNFYGTTEDGGTNGLGTVFEFSTRAV